MSGEDGDHRPWIPNGVSPKQAPAEREPGEDLRWRPAREPPTVPREPAARSWQAVTDQCHNARVPGYTGFIPSARAEDVYGRTQAAVGERSIMEQARRQQMRSASVPGGHMEQHRGGRPAHLPATPSLPDEHPLGRSRCDVVRSHWVPTIPGYAGHIPGKHAENICGGGIIHTCKMAGRAIAERGGVSFAERPPSEDATATSRSSEPYSSRPYDPFAAEEAGKVRLAADIRDHCEKQIPGYTGHVPRIKGDSICGARAHAANMLAADLAQDRIFNPDNHASPYTAPYRYPPKQIRF